MIAQVTEMASRTFAVNQVLQTTLTPMEMAAAMPDETIDLLVEYFFWLRKKR